MKDGSIIKIAGTSISHTASGNYSVRSYNFSYISSGSLNITSPGKVYYISARQKKLIDPDIVVHFRPQDSWRGEDFGFDWFRIGDSLLDPASFVDIVGKYYRDNVVNSTAFSSGDIFRANNGEPTDRGSLQKLREEYDYHLITKDPNNWLTGKPTYCVPWLSLLYGKTAILKVMVSINSPADSLVIVPNEYFDIDPTEFPAGSSGEYTIAIKCIKRFNIDQTLLVQAVRNTPAGDLYFPAGKIRVMRNTLVTKQKIVMVHVKTQNGGPTMDVTNDCKMIRLILNQALIRPVIKKYHLDLRFKGRFKELFLTNSNIGGQPGIYVRSYCHVLADGYNAADPNNQLYQNVAPDDLPLMMANKVNQGNLQYYADLKYYHLTEELDVLLADQLLRKPQTEKYHDFIRVFVFPYPSNGSDHLKNIMPLAYQDTETNNVILYSSRNDDTAAHEVLHAMGLYHTFDNSEFNSEIPFTYEQGATNNVMDYSAGLKFSSFHWQWEQIHRKGLENMDDVDYSDVENPDDIDFDNVDNMDDEDYS